jgi:diaminopimelate epimerase
MRVPFRKMHGAGNDFIIVDRRDVPVPLSARRIAALAERHRGIGCDQLVTIERDEHADARLRFFNPDGGEAGACGNGTRCAASLLMAETGRPSLRLRTAAGELAARQDGGQVCVDMGLPLLGWRDIPLARAMDTLELPLPGGPAVASMGNPHVTFFTGDLDGVLRLGPSLEHDPLFPEGVNVGFAHVTAPDSLRLRVWERGAGLTLACGSGACAAVVNAHRRGLTGRSVRVSVDGGALDIVWRDDGHVEMSGPVALAFEGQIDVEAYPA